MAHIAPWKKEEVQELVAVIKENPVIAVANVEKIPSPSMQKIRRSLRNDATIRVAKNTLIALALREVAKENGGGRDKLADLASKMSGSTALIATKMNPFRLYRKLDESKTAAPAKAGDIAPDDIGVKKGETPFKPGPIVGELQKAGIPAAIEEGKVVIKQDKVLVKKGQPVPAAAAAMLSRLEIFPMTVGVDLKAAYDNGTIFGSEVLGVDDKKFMADLQLAARSAMNLAVFAGYASKQTIEPLLAKAHREALALAVEATIFDAKAIDLLLAKANAQGLAIARKLRPEALDEDISKQLK
ncbi:MAG: 50S ribosomal protein L10 [Methanobacteriota archaeon]